VQRIAHIETVPRYVEGEKGNVSCLWKNARQIQEVGKRDTCPFGDETPVDSPANAALSRSDSSAITPTLLEPPFR